MRVKIAGGVLALTLLLPGCLKREEFPPEPAITFKSFQQFNDSASLTISFTDGDGDIGLDASDNQPPFDTASDNYYNFFLDMDKLQNGEWSPVEFEIPLHYRIPRISPTGQNKALEGEIAVALTPWPYLPASMVDTIRFHVYLVDRALHVSNTVSSGTIAVTP